MPTWTRFAARACALAALVAGATVAKAQQPAEPEPPKIDWTQGPAKVNVGASIAEVQLPEGLAFAGPADSRKLLEAMGNPTDGSEMGIIIPKADDQNWFIVFEWRPVGYVKDEDKDKIDADELLESIREGTEAANEERKKRGMSAMHVVGWSEPPRFDDRTKNLTWALLGRNDDGHESINYNVRVLGREGVMSVTLVDEPQNLAKAKPAVDGVLAAFTYKPGKRYAEWVPGDKVAEYGLAALVAAGAGAAAVKLGFFGFLAKLFAKGGKLIVVALAGIGAIAVKVWNAARGKMSARPAPRPGTPDAGA
ncbi:MAG TPA: DUF2167 domain-containing protein [Anaeromyxobacter sp.]|nr:DUF2167 domain-containing protein [Anaeromyxobacter sp.]